MMSEDAGIHVGVSPVVGTRWFREHGGMPPHDFPALSGRYLSFAEREEIAILRAEHAGVREIARRARPCGALAPNAPAAPTEVERHLPDGAAGLHDYRIACPSDDSRRRSDRR